MLFLFLFLNCKCWSYSGLVKMIFFILVCFINVFVVYVSVDFDMLVISKVYFDISIGKEFKGRIVIGLFGKIVFKIVKNFKVLVLYEVCIFVKLLYVLNLFLCIYILLYFFLNIYICFFFIKYLLLFLLFKLYFNDL